MSRAGRTTLGLISTMGPMLRGEKDQGDQIFHVVYPWWVFELEQIWTDHSIIPKRSLSTVVTRLALFLALK